MVIKGSVSARPRLLAIGAVVWTYVAVALGTIAALAVLSVVAPYQATQAAWVHAVIVAVLAVVLPLRLRAARAGSLRGLRAVGLISAVLFLVNVVEAVLPGLFPVWMRVEMIGIAVLMLVVILLVVRERLAGRSAS